MPRVPTSDRVREAIFNILVHGIPDFELDGAKVLDLFAGTGALGLEALSRGASFCLFVEESAEARALIRRNVEALGLTGATKIFRRDATDLGPAQHRGGHTLVFPRSALWPGPGGAGAGERRRGRLAGRPAPSPSSRSARARRSCCRQASRNSTAAPGATRKPSLRVATHGEGLTDRRRLALSSRALCRGIHLAHLPGRPLMRWIPATSAGMTDAYSVRPIRCVYPSARCGRDSRASIAASTLSCPSTMACTARQIGMSMPFSAATRVTAAAV